MPEYRHTQTLQKTDEAQQVPFLERGDQNIVKNAQTQRQVHIIQKMPSEIHSTVQNMLMRGSLECSIAIARSSAADLEPTTDELGDERECERERKGEHEGFTQSIQWTAYRKEGAHRRPQTKSRQNSEMWGRPHSRARDTAAQ